MTLLAFILGPDIINDGDGLIDGVEQWLLLKSHWSSSFHNSSGVGPPENSLATITEFHKK
jgi:hypothetical protein